MWPLLYRDTTPLGSLAELATRYQATPTSEGVYLALVGALGAMLAGLAFDYRREPSDVLFALMQACRRPLLQADPAQEIRGRLRGILQEMNAREGRQSTYQTQARDAGAFATEASPILEERPDLQRALAALKEKYRRVILLAEQGFTDAELCAEGLAKSPEAARSLLKDARGRLRVLLGGDPKK